MKPVTTYKGLKVFYPTITHNMGFFRAYDEPPMTSTHGEGGQQ